MKNSGAVLTIGALIFVRLVGCSQEPVVRSYQVAKEIPAEASNLVEDRMLVAMVTRGERVWFVKAVGSADLIGARADDLRQLVTSISFDDGGKPEWQLPEGWKEQKSSGIRYATLSSGDSESAVEATVISLPAPQELLANVNRWRRQLGLSPTTESKLAAEIETIKGDGIEAKWIDLTGRFEADQSMAPFAEAPVIRQSVHSASPAAYVVPEHWQPGKLSSMRKAAYEVMASEGKAEITVTTLAAAGGALLPNVNRWRGQVGLEPVDEQDLKPLVSVLPASSVEGDYVQIVGEAEGRATTLLAVTFIHKGRAWFFKMMGDSAVVEQEKEAFERFVKSASFDD